MMKGVVKGAFTDWFELKAQSCRAGKSARNTPARRKNLKSDGISTQSGGVRLYYSHQQRLKNEQNREIFEGELRLELVELFEVQTPPVARRAFPPGGHSQTPGNRGNADEETRLPGEEDRARNYDSQEEWHKKQTGYILFLFYLGLKLSMHLYFLDKGFYYLCAPWLKMEQDIVKLDQVLWEIS